MAEAQKTAANKFPTGMPATPPPSPEKWSCRDLRGTIDEVVKQLTDYKPLSSEDIKAKKTPDANIRGIIPDEDLAWMIRKVEAKRAFGWRGVVVDVHDHAPDSNDDVGSWHISKLY